MRFHTPSLRRLRSYAESLMTDACVVERPGRSVTDPVTGLPSTPALKVYEGRCKVQSAGGLAAENVEGSAAINMGAVSLAWSLRVDLPWNVTGLKAGDLVTISASGNPNLVGSRFRLVSPHSEKSHATACRWNVKEGA
jgi:hypothetical protein